LHELHIVLRLYFGKPCIELLQILIVNSTTANIDNILLHSTFRYSLKPSSRKNDNVLRFLQPNEWLLW